MEIWIVYMSHLHNCIILKYFLPPAFQIVNKTQAI